MPDILGQHYNLLIKEFKVSNIINYNNGLKILYRQYKMQTQALKNGISKLYIKKINKIKQVFAIR